MFCYVRVITAPARGALAVLQVWGPDALDVVDAVWRPRSGRALRAGRGGRPRLGSIGAGLGDEVVATIIGRRPPRVELHGHGGAAAVELVIDSLRGAGAELRADFEWARADAGGTLESAAMNELARAPTARAAEILLDQTAGALSHAIAETAELCLDVAGFEAARSRLRRLIDVGRAGVRLVAGTRVAILGRPNVGKSSLLNALLGYERAIVDRTAGTTRDVVAAQAAVDGRLVEFIDTAGLRDARDDIESAGIEAARGVRANVDIVILVFDGSQPLESADEQVLALRDDRTILVANKCDLPAGAWMIDTSRFLNVSAARRDGLDALRAQLAAKIAPHPPEAGEAVPFLDEHLAALAAALESLQSNQREEARATLLTLLS